MYGDESRKDLIMKRMKIKDQARQGDVGIFRVEAPAKTTAKPIDPRGVVLAEGEATGHHHRIRDPGVCALRAEGVAYDLVRIETGALLVHEEHAPIEIGPGTFEVRIAREHDWNAEAEEVSRAVAD
jgi:hypothetical protein